MADKPEKPERADSPQAALKLAIREFHRRAFAAAFQYAHRAVEMAPDDPRAHFTLARVVARMGRPGRALESFARTAALAPDDFKIQYRAGRFCLSIRPAAAIPLFGRALALSPDNGPAHLGLGIALNAKRNFAAAARELRRASELMPASARAAGQLGIALAHLGEHEEAIRFLRDATERAPNWVEALTHLGRVLVGREQHRAALPHLRRAVELNPANLDACATLVRALAATGRIDEADMAIDAAASNGLDRDSAAELRADCDALRRVRDPSMLPASVAFAPQPIDASPAPGVGKAALVHARVVWALVLRELRTRFGRHRLGYIWAFIEPLLHVATLAVIFTLVGRRAPQGMTMITLLTTGIVPWLAFQSTYSRIQPAFAVNRSLLYFRQVTPLDLIVARAGLELATKFVILAVLLLLLDATDQPIAMPDPLLVIGSMLGMWVAGFGVGLFVAPMTRIFPAIDQLVSLAVRILYFMSGVFFVVRELHPILRPYALYNPFLHFIESLREGFFAQYETAYVDLAYAWSFAIATLFFGLVAERALRRQVMR